MAESDGKTALVVGATGLIGGKLLPVLQDASEFRRVHVLSRRPLNLTNARLANRVVRFDAPLGEQLKGLQCQVAFCCLGTTMRTAGSEAAFRAVDHDLVVQFASFAQSAGAQQLIVVSSVGADPASKNFYLRTKGEMEQSLERLRFRSLSILQPSILLGARRETRVLELIAQPAMYLAGPLMMGNFAKFRAIDGAQVARAMYGLARMLRLGVTRYTFPDLLRLAAQADK